MGDFFRNADSFHAIGFSFDEVRGAKCQQVPDSDSQNLVRILICARMRRPLGYVALAYAMGLIVANGVPLPPWLLFALAFSVALIALLAPERRKSLVFPLVLLTAWTNLAHRTAIVSPNDLRLQLDGNAEEVVIRGTLAGSPSERIRLRNEVESRRTLAEIHVSQIRKNGEWRIADGTLLATVSGVLPEVHSAGQVVEVSGTIAFPAQPVVWGLFDYRSYLQRQGIHFQLITKVSDWVMVSVPARLSISQRFVTWSQQALSRGLPRIDAPVRLLWAMALGCRDVLPNEAYEPFIISGTMHLFAISGLHMGLIAAILVALCRVTRVPRHWCGVVVIPLLWFYTGATGWTASAVRASVMMSIVVGGWSLRRPVDLLNSFSTAALVILVWDPQQLFQAGFQLSFLVVFSMALLLPPFEQLRDKLLQADPWLPPALVPRWKRWAGIPLRHVATAVISSIAAWLGAWPLTAYYFHLFSPVTVLSNLLMVPLGSAALACTLGSLFCGPVFPFLGELFNHSGWLWMVLMTKIGEAAAKLPGAFFYQRAPEPIDMGIYYSALIYSLSGHAFRRKFRMWTFAAVLAIGCFYGARAWHSHRTAILYAIPCSGSNAVYIDAPGSSDDILVDCGNADAFRFVVEPFLRSRGVDSLGRLVVTHGDARAMAGAEQLIAEIPTRHVITSGARFRSAPYRAFLKTLEARPAAWEKVMKGDTAGTWSVLHPAAAARHTLADDACLVLKGTLNGVSILLLSELGREGQMALLESGADLRADIVITGIPERAEPLRADLLDAIAPALIVVADAELPATKRATPALRQRLENHPAPVIYMRDSGAVKITARDGQWSYTTRK